MMEIVQGLAKILKIKWKLYIAYRPQSSGKVESMNWTLKTALAKLCQETQSPWIVFCLGHAFPLDPLATHPLRFSMAGPSNNKQAQRGPQANWKSEGALFLVLPPLLERGFSLLLIGYYWT
jgi:hypothetical protein